MSSFADKRIQGVSLLFFISGFAALLYQVAWQRLLFLAFGVDMTSVTLIVSAFMLGLGGGALLGGWWVDQAKPSQALAGFAVAEACVGLFGFASPWVLRALGEWGGQWSQFGVGAASFGILLLPTAAMGATLPILVTFLGRMWRHIGAATGLLYSVNTLGGALGAIATGVWMFDLLTLDEAILLAATLNLMVAGFAWLWLSKTNSGEA